MAEVFNKTLALFSAIMEWGCTLKTELSSVFDRSDEDPDNNNEEEDNGDNEIMPIFRTECSGKLVMRRDRLNRSYIRRVISHCKIDCYLQWYDGQLWISLLQGPQPLHFIWSTRIWHWLSSSTSWGQQAYHYPIWSCSYAARIWPSCSMHFCCIYITAYATLSWVLFYFNYALI